MEQLLTDSGHQLTRLVVDLTRPVPMAGFKVEAEMVRPGRSVSTLRSALIDREGRQLVTANGLALRQLDGSVVPSTSSPQRELSQATPGEFPIKRTLHHQPGFAQSTKVRYPPNETSDPGPTTIWMATVPLIEGEEPSPFQRICPLADCGNAFSRNAEPWDIGFVNPDLTIVLDRQPKGAWLGSSSHSRWHDNGTGVAYATLFDQDGDVGTATQTLLITPT